MIIQGNNPHIEPSFSLKNRVFRLLWWVVWVLFFYPTPTPLHGWRGFLLKLFGAEIGKGVHVYPRVKIWAPWNLRLDDYVGIANNTTIYNMSLIEIGSFSVISQGVHLCCGSHDIESNNFQLISKPISIGEKVWVCADAFIGLGVNVPAGCVIGARSVVVKSINQPWSVWVGNPSTFKKMRKQS